MSDILNKLKDYLLDNKYLHGYVCYLKFEKLKDFKNDVFAKNVTRVYSRMDKIKLKKYVKVKLIN